MSSDPFQAHLERKAAELASRIIHTFTVPAKTAAALGGQYTSIEMHELTLAEENRVMRAIDTEANAASFTTEMAKASFVGVNGVTSADPGALFETLPPKIRHLIVNAYSSIHFAPDTEDFLASGQVLQKVG